jgi:hypothetical protein
VRRQRQGAAALRRYSLVNERARIGHWRKHVPPYIGGVVRIPERFSAARIGLTGEFVGSLGSLGLRNLVILSFEVVRFPGKLEGQTKRNAKARRHREEEKREDLVTTYAATPEL